MDVVAVLVDELLRVEDEVNDEVFVDVMSVVAVDDVVEMFWTTCSSWC